MYVYRTKTQYKIIIAPFIDSPMFNAKYLAKHKVQIRVELRVRLARHETRLSPPVKYFNWPFQGGASFVDHLCYFCLIMPPPW